MAQEVVKAIQLSVFTRTLFGMCPYYTTTRKQVDPRNYARSSLISTYTSLIGYGASVALLISAYLQMEKARAHGDNEVFGETLFGSGITNSVISIVILTMSVLTNFFTYTVLLIITIVKRKSLLTIYRNILLIVDRLDKEYNGKVNIGQLK